MTTPYLSSYTGAQVDAVVGKVQLLASGTHDLGLSVQAGQVTGLGLSFVPTEIFLQVEVPGHSEDLLLFAVPIRGTVTADQFSFFLSGETDNTEYRLHYLLVGFGDTESEP